MKRIVPSGKNDQYIEQIRTALAEYEREHAGSKFSLYRQNPASIRIRIIDPDFRSMSWAERDDLVWQYLQRLSDNVQSQITMVVLLAPAEIKDSWANDEFEHPTPSAL